jgi:N-acetylgalactosamine kinase
MLECIQTDDQEKYTSKSFASTPTISAANKHWSDYVVAIYLGFQHKFTDKISGRHFKVEVCGNIPKAAGVSSSSALVVAVGMALHTILDIDLDRLALAELCIEFEKLAGTAGGGMDQTCILLAKKHQALLIEFVPRLVARPVTVPGKFIAAHSLVEAAKAVDAATKFNRRVLECRVAAKLLNCALLKEAAMRWNSEQLLEKIDSVIPDTYLLDATMMDGMDACMQEAAVNSESLKPRARARHVVTEAQRVDAFISAAARDDTVEMGKIMDASDRSCHEDYDCGCVELAELTQCFRDAGCLGARLTGAGWGGFAIALVRDEDVTRVLDFVKEKFYAKRGITDTSAVLFEFEPEDGAHVVL